MAAPAPRIWQNTDKPTVADVNLDWRDTLRWLLGNRPGFVGYTTTAQTSLLNTWQAVPINTETGKRGGITHAANDTKIYVPESGWYVGHTSISYDDNTSGTTWHGWSAVRANGTEYWGKHSHHALATAEDVIDGARPFSAYLNAGDYVELVWQTNNTTLKLYTAGGLDSKTSISIFYWSRDQQ